MSSRKVLADLASAVLGQVDAFLEAVGELDGEERARLLTRGCSRLGRPPFPPRSRDEIPARGSWEAYGEVEQLERLVAVFKALRAPGRLHLTAYARALTHARPTLPPGYSR